MSPGWTQMVLETGDTLLVTLGQVALESLAVPRGGLHTTGNNDKEGLLQKCVTEQLQQLTCAMLQLV